jgi:D-aspartate ligase
LSTRSADALPRALILDPQDSGLAVARALVRRGVQVLSLGSASAAWVAASRGVHGIELPSIAGGEERWVERICELAGDGAGVLIACSDRAAALLAEHRARIPEEMRSFESADGRHLLLMDKSSLYAEAARIGVRHPWWRTVSSVKDLESAAAAVEFPCLLKPALSHLWRALFGEERVLTIGSAEELSARARPALAAGLTLMLTEHVPGPESGIEHHVAIRAPDGSYPLDYTSRKLRQFPLGFGAATLMVSDAAPETRELSMRLLEGTGFTGMATVEAKRHADTGERVLIEVNVRIPRVFGLGDVSGADASFRLYRALAGLPLGPQPPARRGVKTLIPALEIRAAPAALRRRDIGALELLRGYRGVRDVGPLDPRDPGPGLALLARAARARLPRR